MGFRKDFLWGASSAAYQIEGGYNADGKGPSIWDVMSRKPGRIAHCETGDVSSDHYHKFRQDVALMKEMGLKHYRFSISWPRVLPQGTGEVNQAGLQFYSDLVDELLAAGIKPMVTLYHWDLPYALYQKGGWRNPQISDWFEAYTQVVVNCLGDRVPFYLTINEPQMFMGLGYKIGLHAPFEQVPDEDLIVMTRNILLAHGKAVRAIRTSLGDKVKVGMAPTGDCYLPPDDSPQQVERARARSFALGDNFVMSNVWWMDPIVLGKLPEEAADRFGDKMYALTDGEMALVSQPLDFYGFNVYQGSVDFHTPFNQYDEYGSQGSPRTCFGWNVTPTVLYWAPKFLYERYKLPILLTENGVSSNDWICLDGKVHDSQRVDFLHRYLRELRRAADHGVDIMGYTCWSLMDNMEWASGYDQRYGLIFVDYTTLERTIKDSGRWYGEVIQANGENL